MQVEDAMTALIVIAIILQHLRINDMQKSTVFTLDDINVLNMKDFLRQKSS